jgi:anthranilate/para-aminobenzoate synthase component I
VDLMRNDVSQIAKPGSVEVTALFREEKCWSVATYTACMDIEAKASNIYA